MWRRSPRPAWQLVGGVQILLSSGCPGSLPVEWVRAQPWGVPTHSRILELDGSLPAQQILCFYNTEPSCASLHLLEPRLSSTGPRCFLVAGMGTRSFSLYFPPRAAEAFPTGWVCKGRLKRRDHKQTYKDWAGKHCTPVFLEGSWGLCSSSGVVAGEFLQIFPI